MSDASKGGDAGHAAASPSESAEESQDDVRRRYREALDRKNKAQHASQEHEDNKGKGPAVNQTVARREFRRKSGG